MIRGHKPSAYFEAGAADGYSKRSGECRMCAHCNFNWEYQPGSGIKRGFCVKCDGWLCGRPECDLLQKALLQQFNLEYGCIPYSDVNHRLREGYAKDPRFEVLPSGIVVERDFRQ